MRINTGNVKTKCSSSGEKDRLELPGVASGRQGGGKDGA